MKQSIARKWAAALDSGEYKQGQDYLRHGNKFCCLAVLCNLHAQAHPEIAAEEKSKGTYLGESHFLPEEVQDWSGMGSSDGLIPKVVVKGESYGELTALNDVAKLTFPEIAKIIRKHWKEL